MKLGIIGAGQMAEVYHLPAFTALAGVQVTAICDQDEARAVRLAKQYGARACKNYGALLASPDVDAVSICTRNDTHAALAIAAANAKKHILLEKPMATSLEDALAIEAAVRTNGVCFLLGMLNRHRTEARLIAARQARGDMGDVYHAEARWVRRRGTPGGWFTQKAISGGGPLLDIGVHALDLAWFLMGRPAPLRASGVAHTRLGHPPILGVGGWRQGDNAPVPDVEDSAAALVRFADGAALQLTISWAINGPGEDFACALYGTKQGATLSPFAFYGERDGYLLDEAPAFVREDPWQEAFARQAAHFLACVRGEAAPLCPAADGVAVQKVLMGIYRSASLGKEVQL